MTSHFGSNTLLMYNCLSLDVGAGLGALTLKLLLLGLGRCCNFQKFVYGHGCVSIASVQCVGFENPSQCNYSKGCVEAIFEQHGHDRQSVVWDCFHHNTCLDSCNT